MRPTAHKKIGICFGLTAAENSKVSLLIACQKPFSRVKGAAERPEQRHPLFWAGQYPIAGCYVN
jgi:hypothetical protein